MGKYVIDSDITLVPYYPAYDTALAWYQDLSVCKQVDNIDHVYTLERLKAMYTCLCKRGECYYIQYRGVLVGDVSLSDCGEIAIVVCKEYQNRHIGCRCVRAMLTLARDKRMPQVKANIYDFNAQSQAMFAALGFQKMDEEWYVLAL